MAVDGSIRKERSPQELAAAALEYCDIVAWGRFVSVCDENYHRTGVMNAEVAVKFAVDDTLFGEAHEFVRTRMSRLMIVWPDTNLSWRAHGLVSGLQSEEAAENGRGLLTRIYESGVPMTGEQHERLSDLITRAASRRISMSPGEIAVIMSKQTAISHGGLSFTLEMGAVTPERTFLVGFSEPLELAKGVAGFDSLSTMLLWGQEAQDVAEQIRMLSNQRADPHLEEEPPSRTPTGESSER